MTKNLKRKTIALAVAVSLCSAAQAGQAEQGWLAGAFPGAGAAEVRGLSAAEMAQTQGKLALLPFIGLVVGADIALASFFWGVYVPTVGGSGCGTVCTSLVQQH